MRTKQKNHEQRRINAIKVAQNPPAYPHHFYCDRNLPKRLRIWPVDLRQIASLGIEGVRIIYTQITHS